MLIAAFAIIIGLFNTLDGYPAFLCDIWGGELFNDDGRAVCLDMSSVGYCLKDDKLYKGKSYNLSINLTEVLN